MHRARARAMNIPDSVPPLLAVLAIAYWPVTAAILGACAATAYMARSAGLRITSSVMAALVIIDALAGAWWLWG